ncbi:MAG: WbqC family protein [Lachnospiraceae bacterium]|nr:WbqC family protein [Lachnospiraceae bacterium]
MILSGHQPNYWPYPGLIGKIYMSDVFMYVTKVQFEKKSWQKRNRVRTKDAWDYIQVPVVTKNKFDQNICDVQINNDTDWRSKTYRTISLLYGKTPYFSEYKDFIEDLYTRQWEYLSELDIHIMNWLLSELKITTKICYDRDYEFEGKKTDMLVDMCRKTGCDTYLSNLGSSAYVEIPCFTDAGLNHKYIDYKGCSYKQAFPGFEGGLSILDMLCCCGTEETRRIITDVNNYDFSELNRDM